MAAPTLAWGAANLYELPSGRHVWGREFELLPGGSMLAAGSILHGLIGVEAKLLDEKRCQIEDGAALILYGLHETETRELDGYREDVIEGFRLCQQQEAQG